MAVGPGDSITKGQTLLLLEAMKMQTIIAAEVEGKVDVVHVQPGRAVEVGDLLITLAK